MDLLPIPERDPPITREAREAFPFLKLVRLYLDPYSLFRDVSSGPPGLRYRARLWNRRMRWMLLAYLRRWSVIAVSLFACVHPLEAAARELTVVPVVAAACAVGSGIAITVVFQILVGYLLLGR